MTAAASVSIDRTSLSLGALTIGDNPGDAYCLTPTGLGDPEMVWRVASMPDSASIHGREITAAALEVSSLPIEVVVSGSSAANLRANRVALTNAVSQFTYTTTVTVDGVAQVWLCEPGNWSVTGGVVRHAHQTELLQVLTVTIPVHPIAS